MPIEYKGYSLNAPNEKKWAEREIALFKKIIDKIELDLISNNKIGIDIAPLNIDGVIPIQYIHPDVFGSQGPQGPQGPQGEIPDEVSKNIQYNTLKQVTYITDSNGTKQFIYNTEGKLINIIGTGVYKSKQFVYDIDNKLIDIIVT